MNNLVPLFILIGLLFGCKTTEPASSGNVLPQIQQYHEGLRAYFKGDYTLADNLANNVIAINPNHDGALYLKSKIYYDQGRLDESANYLLKAGKADPNNTYLSSEIAFMYSSLGKYNEAGIIFENLLKSNPREMLTYNNQRSDHRLKPTSTGIKYTLLKMIQKKQFNNSRMV